MQYRNISSVTFFKFCLPFLFLSLPSLGARYRLNEGQFLFHLSSIRDEQLHPMQSSILEAAQEAKPPLLVLLCPFRHSQNLPVSVRTYPNGNKDRYHADLARPASLQTDPVKIHVGKRNFYPTAAPFLDIDVRFLVQLADRTSGNFRAPQGFGNILHPPH